MKTVLKTIEIRGVVSIPVGSQDTSNEEHETLVLNAIQSAAKNSGALFLGEVVTVDSSSITIQVVEQPEESPNTEQVNQTRQLPVKNRKYPRSGPKMHWKTREKLKREGKLKK